MRRTVFILGAGASAHTGAPLMGNFFDRAREVFASGVRADIDSEFKLVFHYITLLQRCHSKISFSVHNLEAVFCAFEMMELLDIEGAATCGLVSALKSVICVTLEQTVKFTVAADGRNVVPHVGYKNFVSLIERTNRSGDSTTSILTFNYDIALEVACLAATVGFAYCLKDDDSRGKIKLLKLHGSLNWFRNALELKVAEVPLRNLLVQSHMASMVSGSEPRAVRILGSKQWEQLGPDYERVPLIVPPSLDKRADHVLLEPVWRAARSELARADQVVVVGYSFPQMDQFFKYLLGLGLMDGAPLRKFIVVDPASKSPEFRSRFEDIIGPGLRERLRYAEDGCFETASQEIERLLK